MFPNESTENYLEYIYILQSEKEKVRAVDLAAALNFSKPSVSTALKRLQSQNYIIINEDHSIVLTDEGRSIAESVYQRHIILKDFFIYLGVDPNTANTDACKIEHDLSEETFHCIKNHFSKIKSESF